MEIADISKQIYRFPKTDYTTVEFLALEIWTSDDAKKKVQFPSSSHSLLLPILCLSLSLYSISTIIIIFFLFFFFFNFPFIFQLSLDYRHHSETVDWKQRVRDF
jgi:hypothetical protein